MGTGSGGQHRAEVGVRHGHAERGDDIGGPVGGRLVKRAIGGPEAVDGTGLPGPPVPAGLNPDGRGNNEVDGAGPAKISGRGRFDSGENPPVLGVGQVDERLDGLVVEDDSPGGGFHAAAARPAA